MDCRRQLAREMDNILRDTNVAREARVVKSQKNSSVNINHSGRDPAKQILHLKHGSHLIEANTNGITHVLKCFGGSGP